MHRYRKKLLYLAMLCGLLPAWVLRCDRAALNFQRGFWQGMGHNVSDLVTDAAIQR
jgi:hypothetical protein